MIDRIQGFLVAADAPPAQRLEYVENSKLYGQQLVAAMTAEAECAAYREALKNVMRSPASKRVKIARTALFGRNTKQRGKELLKVVKAAVQFCQVLRMGAERGQMKALRNLELAFMKWKASGTTAKGWLKMKGSTHGT